MRVKSPFPDRRIEEPMKTRAKKIVTIGPLPDWARAQLEARYRIVSVGDSDRGTLVEALDETVVCIIARGAVQVDSEIMDRAPSLHVISRTGVGYDSVSIPEATLRRIPVVYTPGAMTAAVAEHALSLILAAVKRHYFWRMSLQTADWDARYREKSLDLEGSTLGIVGYGRIGRQLRKLVRPFGVTVLADDPYIDHTAFEADEVRFVELEEMLAQSDIVSLHVPLNEETCGLINARNIPLIKKGAILINTARGQVVDSLDLLYDCLEAGILGAVGMDVFPEEPPDPGHPLLHHPRCYFTGHVAARTPISQKRILETMLRETLAILEGGVPDPSNIVNPEVL